MNIINAIRAGIVVITGLAFILFPEKVYEFQIYLIGKLRVKYNAERDRKHYLPSDIILIIFQ